MLILMILVVLLVAVTMFAFQNVAAGSLRFLYWDLGALSRPQRKGRGGP